jgi:hypothetical protein
VATFNRVAFDGGYAIGVAPGMARIVASSGGYADTAVVVVLALVGSAVVTPRGASIEGFGEASMPAALASHGRGAALAAVALRLSVLDAATPNANSTESEAVAASTCLTTDARRGMLSVSRQREP